MIPQVGNRNSMVNVTLIGKEKIRGSTTAIYWRIVIFIILQAVTKGYPC